jgi:hypothetical protein
MDMKRLLLFALAAAALGVVAPAVAMAPMHPELSAKLVGSQEVPPGSKTAHGIVNLDLTAKTGKVCWTFDITGVSSPTAAHIHKAPPGKSGPVVVPFGGSYSKKGCTIASKSLVNAIEEHPSSYYVNVHNARFPNGAIRGQLVVGLMSM